MVLTTLYIGEPYNIHNPLHHTGMVYGRIVNIASDRAHQYAALGNST